MFSMPNYDLGNPAMNAWWHIRQAREAMYKSLSAALARHQCTTEQFEALSIVGSHPDGVTVAELSFWMAREKQSANTLMARVEKAGLAYREKPKGRRTYVYHLTDNGRQVLNEARPVVEEVVNGLNQLFTEDKLAELASDMEKIRDMYLEQLWRTNRRDFAEPQLPVEIQSRRRPEP